MPVCAGCRRFFPSNASLDNHQRQRKSACHQFYSGHDEDSLISSAIALFWPSERSAERVSYSGQSGVPTGEDQRDGANTSGNDLEPFNECGEPSGGTHANQTSRQRVGASPTGPGEHVDDGFGDDCEYRDTTIQTSRYDNRLMMDTDDDVEGPCGERSNDGDVTRPFGGVNDDELDDLMEGAKADEGAEGLEDEGADDEHGHERPGEVSPGFEDPAIDTRSDRDAGDQDDENGVELFGGHEEEDDAGSDLEPLTVPSTRDDPELNQNGQLRPPSPPHDDLDLRRNERPRPPLISIPCSITASVTSVHRHPNCVQDLGAGVTILDKFHNDPHSPHRDEHPYFPFQNLEEWEFASILERINVSITNLDLVLSSKLIKGHSLSYTNGASLRGFMENLPGDACGLPKWTCRTVSLPDYPTADPIEFFYRDSAECVEHLFGNPLFADFMSLSARKEYDSNGNRVYSEWVTGDMAWRVQDSLPEGAVPLGVITSSDKTALTSHAGNKVAHPLLLSLANIDMSVRNRSSYHAFLLLGLMPIPKFYETNRKILNVLYYRVFHLCLDIAFAPLKKIAAEGALMTDPRGRLRRCHTVLASYMVDYPEALMLAGVMGLTSPVTTASYLHFGNAQPHPRRYGAGTVRILEAIMAIAHPWDDIYNFVRLARNYRLSGVDKPFYRDWLFTDPTLFLTPDRLHSLLKKFWDHDVQWCIAALTANEIDFRYSLLPERVGFRHFHTGISSLKMTTGREHRDIQRSIVAVILGGSPLEFVRCIRALVDFFYISQKTTITEGDLPVLQELLDEFHRHKDIILNKSYRDINNWYIPKIELLHNIIFSVREMGVPRQWSTDRTEHAHIEVVKRPFRASSKKNYTPQICRYLDRSEKRRYFDLCTAIKAIYTEKGSRANPTILLTEIDPAYTWLEEMRTVESLTALDRDTNDYFVIAARVLEMKTARSIPRKQLTKKRTFSTASTAFHLNGEFDAKLTIEDAELKYGLPDLFSALIELCDGIPGVGGWPNAENIPPTRLQNGVLESCIGRRRRNISTTDKLPFTHIRVWEQVRVQTRPSEGGRPFSPVVIKSMPPRGCWLKGRYDCCVLKNDISASWSGKIDHRSKAFSVGQVRLIFQPVFHRNVVPFAPYFVYVQRFDSLPRDVMYAASHLPKLQRSMRQSASETVRRGGVVALTRVLTAVDVVPYFGERADERLTKYNSMEISTQFHLNIYSDKHIHHMFSTDA